MQDKEEGFSVVEALIIIILIALVAGMGLFFIGKRKKADNQQVTVSNKSTSTIMAESNLKPEDVIGKVKSYYASRYKIMTSTQSHYRPDRGEMFIEESKGSPSYKVPGFKFRNGYDGGQSLSLSPYSDASIEKPPRPEDSSVRAEIAKIYIESGLSKTESLGSSSDGSATDIYTGKGVVCSVEPPASAISPTSYASCGLISAYRGAAEQIEPLADAIPNVDDTFIFDIPKISNSMVSGYQKAKMSQHFTYGTGSIALLYKKDNNPWIFFKNLQQAPYCSDFNTVDLRNAFKGDDCYGANGESLTVK